MCELQEHGMEPMNQERLAYARLPGITCLECTKASAVKFSQKRDSSTELFCRQLTPHGLTMQLACVGVLTAVVRV